MQRKLSTNDVAGGVIKSNITGALEVSQDFLSRRLHRVKAEGGVKELIAR